MERPMFPHSIGENVPGSRCSVDRPTVADGIYTFSLGLDRREGRTIALNLARLGNEYMVISIDPDIFARGRGDLAIEVVLGSLALSQDAVDLHERPARLQCARMRLSEYTFMTVEDKLQVGGGVFEVVAFEIGSGELLSTRR